MINLHSFIDSFFLSDFLPSFHRSILILFPPPPPPLFYNPSYLSTARNPIILIIPHNFLLLPLLHIFLLQLVSTIPSSSSTPSYPPNYLSLSHPPHSPHPLPLLSPVPNSILLSLILYLPLPHPLPHPPPHPHSYFSPVPLFHFFLFPLFSHQSQRMMTSLEAESASLREEVQHARLQSEENNRQVNLTTCCVLISIRLHAFFVFG